MPEYAWQALLVDLAHAGGWRVMSIRPPKRDPDGRSRSTMGADGKGWPDLTCVRPGRLVVIECKRVGERPRPEQRRWLDDLAAAGAEAYVWTPLDEPEARRVLLGRTSERRG
jgi:hypothetical protein